MFAAGSIDMNDFTSQSFGPAQHAAMVSSSPLYGQPRASALPTTNAQAPVLLNTRPNPSTTTQRPRRPMSADPNSSALARIVSQVYAIKKREALPTTERQAEMGRFVKHMQARIGHSSTARALELFRIVVTAELVLAQPGYIINKEGRDAVEKVVLDGAGAEWEDLMQKYDTAEIDVLLEGVMKS